MNTNSNSMLQLENVMSFQLEHHQELTLSTYIITKFRIINNKKNKLVFYAKSERL